MKLNQLKYFCLACEKKSITKAAALLNEVFDQVDRCAGKLNPQCHVMYPETGKWYDL